MVPIIGRDSDGCSTAGLAGICGKLLTGWLLDRFKTGWVPGISLSIPALACALLLEPLRSTSTMVAAMIIFGYSGGAYLQVCTYLVSRHGGLRHFGKIFGVMASLMSLGSALGPWIASKVFDTTGSYQPLLLGAVPFALLAGYLVGGLGPYPQWQAPAADNG